MIELNMIFNSVPVFFFSWPLFGQGQTGWLNRSPSADRWPKSPSCPAIRSPRLGADPPPAPKKSHGFWVGYGWICWQNLVEMYREIQMDFWDFS